LLFHVSNLLTFIRRPNDLIAATALVHGAVVVTSYWSASR